MSISYSHLWLYCATVSETPEHLADEINRIPFYSLKKDRKSEFTLFPFLVLQPFKMQ